jgi:hypothetical protein
MVTDVNHQPPAGDWRQGAAAVAVLSLNVDAEAPILAEGDHYAEDLSAMSHQAYGPRVGVLRILELLAAREIEATFFVPGVTAERWPGTVEKVLQAGHEVALHGHSHNHGINTYQDRCQIRSAEEPAMRNPQRTDTI